MATQDISRSASDFRKHYHGVQLQQGRVLDDDDFNEADRLAAEVRRRTTVELVGPHGTSNDGFAITDARITPSGELDFAIGVGSLFIGGLRAELEQAQRYLLQADWLSQPTTARQAPAGARVDLVYLQCWQQPVVAVEDAELFEVALGGPDTSTRIRTMARVAVRPNVQDDCLTAWDGLVADLAANHSGALSAEHELVPDARLTVGFDPSGNDPLDLCTPLASGGYLGAENQAIRIQVRPGGAAFTWGFDNASSLYRATVADTKVTLLTEPKDHLRWPLAGQVVEILPWAAVLPNGEKLAEAEGHISRVSASYDPDTREFSIEAAPPAGFGSEWQARDDSTGLGGEFFFVRVWDRGADTTSPPEIPLTPGTPQPLSGTGLTVRFDGTDFRSGDHWIIAARPDSPNRVVPWRLELGMPPDAVRLFVAPLALVRWPSGAAGTLGVVADCRATFEQLTECSCGGSCTVVVRPGGNLQAAVDRLPAEGGSLCLQTGVYELSAPVSVRNRNRIIVSGAGPATIVRARQSEAAVVFDGCAEVTVRSLRVEGGPEAAQDATGLDGALTFVGCSDVTVADCALACPDLVDRPQMCLTIRGREGATSDRISVERNLFEVGAWQTAVLVVDVGQAAIVNNRVRLGDQPEQPQLGGPREFISDEIVRRMRDAIQPEPGPTTREVVVGDERLNVATGQPGASLVTEFARRTTPRALARAKSVDAAMRTFVRELLRGRHTRDFDPAARALLDTLLGGLRAGGQGIVAAGQRLGTVRILDNVVEDVVQGIHVGVSHADIPGPERVDEVLISRNVVHLLVPAAYDRDRLGVFVGNAASTHVKDTIATLTRIGDAPATGPTEVEGVRVHGALGAFLSVRQTSLSGFTPVGIRVVPVGTPPSDRMWLISETMAVGASLGCDAPASVTQERNFPSRRGVIPTAVALQLAIPSVTAGQEQTVTAVATGAGGAPVAGAQIRFVVTGANPTSGSATTGPEGRASFAFTGVNIGTDTVTAFADINGNGVADPGEPTASANVTCGPDVPQKLTITPTSATKRVAVQHCVTATVTDSFGNPTPGVTLRFSASGANTSSGTQQANGAGQAVFCYTGTAAGNDVLRVFADIDNSGEQGVGEPSANATVTYTAAAEPPNCDELRGQIDDIDGEIRDLQDELRTAPPSEKAALAAAIRAAQRRRQQVVAAAREAGCIP
jgi:hypothetical protein